MDIIDTYEKTIDRRSGLDRRQPDTSLSVHWERRHFSDRRNIFKSSEKIQASNWRNWKFIFGKSKRTSAENDMQPFQMSSSEKKVGRSKFIERAYDRITYDAPILFEDYDTRTTSPGTIYNYSKGGMYLEVEYFPMNGTGALIHMMNYSPDASEPENLIKYYVQVKWVEKISGMVVFNRYGIGVEYCNDVKDLFRLFGH